MLDHEPSNPPSCTCKNVCLCLCVGCVGMIGTVKRRTRQRVTVASMMGIWCAPTASTWAALPRDMPQWRSGDVRGCLCCEGGVGSEKCGLFAPLGGEDTSGVHVRPPLCLTIGCGPQNDCTWLPVRQLAPVGGEVQAPFEVITSLLCPHLSVLRDDIGLTHRCT